MLLAYYILTILLIVLNILPTINHQHWMFRVWEFGKIQIVLIQIVTLALGILFIADKGTLFWGTAVVSGGFIIFNSIILTPYTALYKKNKTNNTQQLSKSISIVSVNVFQFNEQYERVINLVRRVKPDILLTIESNQAWEDAMAEIEEEYPNSEKVALENTYGIHFYTKLSIKSVKTNFFVADDIPSIEASVITESGVSFTFFGVHPPPPSPTEEDNSKERDGELLSLGKRIEETTGPVIVVGDFNNVAWAKSSILFRKTAELIDPRIGRGFVSTYHAKYKLLRFPIDLFFHSTGIFVEEFKTLENIGSDHLPLFCKFSITSEEKAQDKEGDELEKEEKEKVNEMIKDGIDENGERPKVAIEE